MSDQASKSSDGGIGTLGWILIIVAGLILLPVLLAFVLGVAGLALKLVFGAIAAVLGLIGAVFGIIVGLLGGILGAILGVLASMSFVLLLLLPGILIGVLLARAMGGKKAE